MGKTTTDPATTVLQAFQDHEDKPYGMPTVWSLDTAAHKAGISTTTLRKILPELLETGRLIAVTQDRHPNENSVLYGCNTRPGATYYMLPTRHQALVAERDERIRERLMAQARQVVSDRHPDEVTAEYERLRATQA